MSKRIALVGAGRIAQDYARAIAEAECVEPVVVVDERPEAARALADVLGVEAATDHDAIDGSTADIALVATPPATHPGIVTQLLERGVSVMCEKPLSVDVASATAIAEAADRSGSLVTMMSKFRYVDDVARAKSILESGILGEVILLENNFTARVDMRDRWNAVPAVSGGGVLIDNGTHSVDVVRFLLGPIVEVLAVEGKRVQTHDVEDTAQLFIRTAGGARATVDLSWTIDKERDTYIDIYGTDGVVRIGWKGSRYRQMSSPAWVPFGGGYDKIAAMRAQIDNFCGTLAGREPLRVTVQDAMASVEVIAAAYESLTSCDWVTPVGAGAPA